MTDDTPPPDDPARSPARVDRLAIVIAFLVATVSIVSAVVASRAAIWASDAGSADSVVLQQAIERQQLETFVRTTAASDLRYVARYDAAHEEALRLAVDAATARDSDPAAAGRDDIGAQTALGVDLVLTRFFHSAVPEYTADGRLVFDAEAAVDAIAAADPRLAELRRSAAAARAATMHERTLQLVGITVLFVAALFLLTIAELRPGRGRWIALLLAAGLATAGAVLTFSVERGTAELIGVIAAGAALVLAVVLLLERRRERVAAGAATGTVPTEEGGERGEDGPSRRFSAVVALVLAAGTLLGAGVGYVQARAGDAGSLATREAEEQALLALAEHGQTAAWAASQVDVWSVVEEQRARAIGARQLAAWLASTGDTEGAAEARAEAERADARAATADAITVLSDDHADGPRADPAFPTRFLQSRLAEQAGRTALQDIANEVSALWGNRFAAYIAMLATLAIAAYLLGLSLVIRTRQLRGLFALTGAGLVLAAAIGSGVTALAGDRSPAPADRAAIAEAFSAAALADVAAATPEERQAAVAAWQRVVALHPTLARARARLSDAIWGAGAGGPGSDTDWAPPDTVRAALAELETAVGLGWDDIGTRATLGAYRFLLGLDDVAGDQPARAVEDARAALAAAPQLPQLGFTLAAALLADGQAAAGAEAIRDAIAALGATGADGALVFAEADRMAIAATALTDLGRIATARSGDPAVVKAAAAARTAIVAAIGDPVPDRAGAEPVQVSDLRVRASSSELWWEGRLDGFDPEGDPLTVVWEQQDPASGAWTVLQHHTGALRPGTETWAGALLENPAAPDWFGVQARLFTSDPVACMADGRYRVGLYQGGTPLGEPAEADIDLPDRVADPLEDLGLVFCRPAAWTEDPAEPGTAAGYRDAAGDPVLLVRRAFRPNPSDAAGVAEVATVATELATGWDPRAVEAAAPPVETYFMGLDHAQAQWWDGPDGSIKVVAGADAMGTVLAVGFVGTPAWVDGDEAFDIQRSFLRY